MIEILPVAGLPEVAAGDDLAALIAARADLRDRDVVVVSQKVVSKAEGAVVALALGEDPAGARRRVAREQAATVVAENDVALIVRTDHGLVCANAGVDASNVADGQLLLLPRDPDASARQIRSGLRERCGADVAVIVSDTFGRPWRLGQTDVAIGAAGLRVLRDERGTPDRGGRILEVTETAVADEVAAAADLVRRKAGGTPVVVVRGLDFQPSDEDSAAALVRPPDLDLFPFGRGGLAAALATGETSSSPWSGPVADADLQRAADAAVGLAGAVEATHEHGHDRTVVRFSADGPARAGVAAGAAAAALVDLGYRARVTSTDGAAFVEAGR